MFICYRVSVNKVLCVAACLVLKLGRGQKPDRLLLMVVGLHVGFWRPRSRRVDGQTVRRCLEL